MKKIGIITQGVKLYDEKGYTRFAYIANFLSNQGFEVELITSSFQHWEKKERDVEKYKQKLPYNITFIYEPGYKKNIDIDRIKSHKVLAKNLYEYLKNSSGYDLLYFEIPPNNVAKIIIDYAEEKGIPSIADVNDLWPEAMKMIIDIPLISNILFYPFRRDAEYVYKKVSAVIGTSEEYANRPSKYNHRRIPKKVVYVGNDLKEFDAGVKEFENQISKKKEEFWVTYAGTLGTSYDIRTLILASEILKKEGYEKIKIKILGGGPLQKQFEELAYSLRSNVEFAGYVPYKKMAAYLKKSDVVVNSFVKKAPQSIVTKIGDYLASGRPMINTCSSDEFRKKVENDGFGVNIEAENVLFLTEAIKKLYNSPELCLKCGNQARHIAEKEFNRESAYVAIVDMIKELLEEV